MPVAVLILVLVAYGLRADRSIPEFRRWAVAGGVVAALGLAFYFSRAGAGGDPGGQPHRRRRR